MEGGTDRRKTKLNRIDNMTRSADEPSWSRERHIHVCTNVPVSETAEQRAGDVAR